MVDLVEYKAGVDEVYRKADIVKQLVALEVGSEGFASNIFVSVANTIGSILTLVKTLTIKLPKNVKRGELRQYYESHLATFGQIKRLGYTEVCYIDVPLPTGMVSRYPDTISAYRDMHKYLGVTAKADMAVEAIKTLHDTILSSDTSVQPLIKHAMLVFDSSIAATIDKRVKKVSIGKVKSLSKATEDTFSNQFKSMTEYYHGLEDCLTLEDMYDDIPKVVKSLNKVQDYLANLLRNKDLMRNLEKKDLNGLSELAYRYAQYFDKYGLVIYHSQRVVHNYLEATKTIISQKKLGT